MFRGRRPSCKPSRDRFYPSDERAGRRLAQRNDLGKACLKAASASGWIPDIRHPGLDPGSTTSTPRWIPDQVRDDEERNILPAAQPWGGGPSPQAMVEGPQPRVICPSVSASHCHLPMAAPRGGTKRQPSVVCSHPFQIDGDRRKRGGFQPFNSRHPEVVSGSMFAISLSAAPDERSVHGP
jgi:hypothetical protein